MKSLPQAESVTRMEKQLKAKEVARIKGTPQPCPNCYGGHFRPCQWCGDTGIVEFVQASAIRKAQS